MEIKNYPQTDEFTAMVNVNELIFILNSINAHIINEGDSYYSMISDDEELWIADVTYQDGSIYILSILVDNNDNDESSKDFIALYNCCSKMINDSNKNKESQE